MGRWPYCGVLLCVAGLQAQLPPPRIVPTRDVWEIAQIENARAGFYRTAVQDIERDGQKVQKATQELNLTVRRYGEVANLRMESGTEETPDGKVVGVSMKQHHQKGSLVIQGTVKGNTLHVDVDNGRIRREIPWNDKVIGLVAQEKIFAKNKVKPGDKLTYQSYEPTLNAVVTVRVSVGEEEEIDLLGKKVKLLRAVITSDRLEVPGASVQLPPATVWLDKELVPVRRQVEIPGLGAVVLMRGTKTAATAAVDTSKLPDVGLATLIPTNRRLARPHAINSAVYRITVVGDAKPETALASDGRQEIKNAEKSSFELHVKAVREPGNKEEKAKEEFVKSCYYVDSDNEAVRRRLAEAVGDEKDPWRQALRIEKWVHDHMPQDNKAEFAPAGQIARSLRGDCRQRAILSAALTRAAGIPSRTAVGLVYVDGPMGQPVFGFHMWFEVFMKGRWVPLDASLGQGSIGAAHIKISDHSWHDVQSLTPLLPVARVLGKMRVEVLRVNGGE